MTAPVFSWPDRRDTAGARTGPATEQGQEVVRPGGGPHLTLGTLLTTLG
ncbi:hypothetical protein ABT215_17245 [Streptomyces sp900105755]